MYVTKIEPVTKTKYKVFIDGQFAFVLYKGELSRYHIAQDTEVDERLVSQILSEIVLKRAKLRAMHLLTDMDRTESQLRTKLKQGLYPDDIIEQAMAYVKSFGYVEDENYARRFVPADRTARAKKKFMHHSVRKVSQKRRLTKSWKSVMRWKRNGEQFKKFLKKRDFVQRRRQKQKKRRFVGIC